MEYIRLATGAKLLQNKNGFAAVRPIGAELYVAEFFARNCFDAVKIFNLVRSEARRNKCSIISAHVENYFPRASALLKLFYRLGFEMHSSTPERTAIFMPVDKPLNWAREEAGAES